MKVSVVIPALDEADGIARCLESVANQSGDVEAIVVDGGSTDQTRDIARRYAIVLTSPCGRGSQMNAGARAGHGDILLFLHADSMLHPDAFTCMRAAFSDPNVAGGTFTLRFDSDRWLLRAYAFFTRFRPRLFHFGDQGIFVRRSAFERLGGFAECPLMEDVDFLRRLDAIGRRVLVPCPVATSPRRFLARGVLRQQFINAGLVLLFSLGVDPEVLARWYGEPPSRASHVPSESMRPT